MNCRFDYSLKLMPTDPERVCENCFRPLRLTRGICLGHEAEEDFGDGINIPVETLVVLDFSI